jgi:hypothetical protein
MAQDNVAKKLFRSRPAFPRPMEQEAAALRPLAVSRTSQEKQSKGSVGPQSQTRTPNSQTDVLRGSDFIGGIVD